MSAGTSIPENKCPHCARHFNRAGVPGESNPAPYPGTFIVCVYCGGISILGDDLRVRKLNDEEMRIILAGSDARERIRYLQDFSKWVKAREAGMNN